MTDAEKLVRLRILIGESSGSGRREDDETLLVYLDMAAEAILKKMYPLKESFEGLEVPGKHVQAQLKIAAYMLNKRGAEGEIQHIENGVHRNYGNADIPDQMFNGIIPFAMAIR